MATKNSNTSKVRAKPASRIVLNEHLDITGAADLHRKLTICAAKGTNVNLNAAKVETIDTTSMQLLLSFVQQECDAGHTINWQSPSEALLRTVALTGLTASLGLIEASE